MVSIYDMFAINKYRSIENDLMNFFLAASDITAARINVLMFLKKLIDVLSMNLIPKLDKYRHTFQEIYAFDASSFYHRI